jgi:ribosomal protein S18 acetylase RimI-like enzyme
VATVRQAQVEDARRIAEIYVASWRSTYAGILPDRILLNMSADIQEARWWRHALTRPRPDHMILVVEDDAQQVVGFGSAGPSRRGDDTAEGEIYTLYVEDEHHGRGLGRDLLLALGEALQRRGMESLVIWVLKENPARFFYQDHGGTYAARRPGRLQGADIEELAYRWADIGDLLSVHKPDTAE